MDNINTTLSSMSNALPEFVLEACQSHPIAASVVGVGAATCTSLIGLSIWEACQPGPQIKVPHYTATILTFPEAERRRLNGTLEAIQGRLNDQKPASQLPKELAKLMQCPEGKGQLQKKHENVKKQLNLGKEIVRLEGQIIDNRRVGKAAQERFKTMKASSKNLWHRLNIRQKAIYCFPTDRLRNGLATVLAVDSDDIKKSCSIKSQMKQWHAVIANCDQFVKNAYYKILGLIHESIDLEVFPSHTRTKGSQLLNAFRLAGRLEDKAGEAQSAIDSYRYEDNNATSLESEANWELDSEQKQELESEAWWARVSADACRDNAISCIEEVQKLARELETSLGSDGSTGLKDVLQSAAMSISSFDLMERWTGCHTGLLGFIHNLAEEINRTDIQNELSAIEAKGGEIRKALNPNVTTLFEKERTLFLGATADNLADWAEFRKALSSYLNTLR